MKYEWKYKKLFHENNFENVSKKSSILLRL